MSAVKRFLGGDVTAVDAVLAELGPRLRACLRARYKCTLADDGLDEIANVAIERAWRLRATFDLAKGKFEAWLWRIASNLAAEVARRRWQRQRRHESGADFDGLAEAAVCVDDLDELDDEAQCADACPFSSPLTRALNCVSDQQRYILLADADSANGLAPDAQLAEELHIAKASVRVYRHRARKRMREELDLLGFRAPAARRPTNTLCES